MRNRSLLRLLSLLPVLVVWVGHAHAIQPPRTISAHDCVQIRYFVGVWMSPDGANIAYLVKSPNLQENHNDYQLYVRHVSDGITVPGKLLLTGTDISAVKWLGDNRHLVMLVPRQQGRSLLSVDIKSGVKQTLLVSRTEIEDYSIDNSGSAVVFVRRDSDRKTKTVQQRSLDEIAQGYEIAPFDASPTATKATYSVYITRRHADGSWDTPRPINFQDPFNHQPLTHLIGPILYVSLSPDGRLLALNYWTSNPLIAWRNSPWVRFSLLQGSLNRIMVVHNLKTNKTSLGFATVFPDSAPIWARDSSSFLINAHSPVGSAWEQDDIRDHRTAGLDANLFWVNLSSGMVEEVFRHPPDHHEGPMFWRPDGDVIVHMLGNAVVRLHHDGNSWQEVERLTVPGSAEDQYWYLNSSGATIIGVHQTITAPEELFVYRPQQKNIALVTDLNPQLRNVTFAPIRKVAWTTPEGFHVAGFLFMPNDYVQGKRYPLVIQTKGNQGQFTCDSGANHDPSFAPQPLANAGIMYLARTETPNYNQEDENMTFPKGYPGQLDVPAHEMEIWDSAVKKLDRQGLIDPERVGIIGFSATGYFVEFALAHSTIHYAAATAADNTQRSLSDYWLFPASMSGLDAVYGGPPFGASLKNWLDYSISFNLDKIHTPLLLESMGYGIHDNVEGEIPINLASRLEIFNGLSRLRKPVELYYYPDENHTPDHPKARLASLQRNVDWYRFWLQDYERPNPEDPDQYKRWEHLRELRDADQKSGGLTNGYSQTTESPR